MSLAPTTQFSSVALCRLMCGRALPFRWPQAEFLGGGCPVGRSRHRTSDGGSRSFNVADEWNDFP